ncbi:transcriptional repressor [Aeromicrobium sp.]|nr:transcriptional repressor [Candidatus Saccharibacteria bacterium]
MPSSNQQMKFALKSTGHSITVPRKQLFKTLQAHEAQTIHELVARCPTVDRATIYRTIELFEELGIVQRLQIGWKYQLELTDSYVHHHHHLVCTRCGAIIALAEDAELEARLITLAATADFTASDHQLEIRGLCSNCH